MATFTATYREARSGILRTMSVDASSRSEAFRILSAQGIHPSALEAGVAQAPPIWRGRGKWTAVCLSAKAVTGLAVWWCIREPSDKEAPRPSRRGPVAMPTQTHVPTVEKPAAISRPQPHVTPTVSAPVVQNHDKVLPKVPSTPNTASSADVESIPPASSHPVLFRCGTDQLIAMAIFQPHDVPLPPMPNMGPGGTQAFLDSLNTPINLPEDAPETLKAMRQAVLEVRADIAKALKADPNTSVQSILEGHRTLHKENIDIRSQAQKELETLLQNGDAVSVKKYLDEVNPVLREMGIAEISVPEEDETDDNHPDPGPAKP